MNSPSKAKNNVYHLNDTSSYSTSIKLGKNVNLIPITEENPCRTSCNYDNISETV